MTSEEEPRASIEGALERTAHLVDVDPVLAAEQAAEILEALPNHPPALYFLAMARRRAGDPEGALEILEPLLNAQHKWAAAWFERGMAYTALGRGDEAIAALLKSGSLTWVRMRTSGPAIRFGSKTCNETQHSNSGLAVSCSLAPQR